MATGAMNNATASFTDLDRKMMLRAIEISRDGEFGASPNPAVGCVIAVGERIIGEGCHHKFGEGHAEVNAMRMVTDPQLLPSATVYVTLEPCSHYGKTPPCASMLIEKGVRKVVIGCGDPNPAVSGRGIQMLREAGIEVIEGVCREECAESLRYFLRANILHRPYIILKWAQSADGFMDCIRSGNTPAARFSTPLSTLAVMRLRAACDAIAVGSSTISADNPSLTVRDFDGKSPARVIFDRRGRVSAEAKVFNNDSVRCVYLTREIRTDLPQYVDQIIVDKESLTDVMIMLRKRYGWISIIIEGGSTLLKSFIKENLYDECRIEFSPTILGCKGTVHAPSVPAGEWKMTHIDGNRLIIVRNVHKNDVF